MTDFCDIGDPSQLEGKVKSYRVMKTSDAGYTRIRPIGSTPKHEWTLIWDTMTETEFDTLVTFFETYYAQSFNWTHPTTSTVYEVYFVNDDLEYSYVHSCKWKVTLTFGEV